MLWVFFIDLKIVKSLVVVFFINLVMREWNCIVKCGKFSLFVKVYDVIVLLMLGGLISKSLWWVFREYLCSFDCWWYLSSICLSVFNWLLESIILFKWVEGYVVVSSLVILFWGFVIGIFLLIFEFCCFLWILLMRCLSLLVILVWFFWVLCVVICKVIEMNILLFVLL